MLMIYDWLKSHTNFDQNLSPEEIRQLFTFHSFEIDGYEDLNQKLQHIIVGKIISIEKHPKADKLKICQVSDGAKTHQVVCGGSNLSENQIIAYCQEGAKVLWHGTDEVTIKNTKIRDVESFGMIAASDEIGLGPSQNNEILDLTALNLTVGQDLHSALNMPNLILDIDNKSITNRPDLWSVIGLARELAAITSTEFNDLEVPNFLADNTASEILKVQINNPEILQRILLLKISNLTICDSPKEIQDKLNHCGIKTINNIVDATNYVLHEMGQPMHAYDTQKINFEDLEICYAKDQTEFAALDQKTYQLTEFDPILKSNAKPQSLLGIIGSQESAITQDTSEILAEVGCFQFNIIRKSANKHKIRTDGVQRQEKQIDPTQATKALNRFIEILKLTCPNLEISSQLYDNFQNKLDEKTIKLSTQKVESYLGIKIPNQEIQDILNRLGFETQDLSDHILVKVPSFRSQNDVNYDYDLIEEIGRIYGYNKIPSVLPQDSCQPPLQYKHRNLSNQIRHKLADYGYFEVKNYSFFNQQDLACSDRKDQALKMKNYLSLEQSHLRTSLIPNMLKNLKLNLKNQTKIQTFEFGRIYLKTENFMPAEETHLSIMQNGPQAFLKLKGALENIIQGYNLKYQFKPSTAPNQSAHPNCCADIIIQGQTIGQIYLINPKVLKQYDLAEEAIAYSEINFGLFSHLHLKTVNLQEFSRFPSISFDLSILCNKQQYHQEIHSCLLKASKLICQVKLFDTYEGSNIPADKKALSYQITLQDPNQTLTSQDQENAIQACLAQLKKIKAEVRQA